MSIENLYQLKEQLEKDQETAQIIATRQQKMSNGGNKL